MEFVVLGITTIITTIFLIWYYGNFAYWREFVSYAIDDFLGGGTNE